MRLGAALSVLAQRKEWGHPSEQADGGRQSQIARDEWLACRGGTLNVCLGAVLLGLAQGKQWGHPSEQICLLRSNNIITIILSK